VHAAGVIGLALSVAAILVCWHHGSSGSTGSDGLARRDYGRDWIGARNRSTIFDSESEMLCGRDRRPQKLFRPTHPQLAESSDDEASRRKIPLESAIATSVSNRKPRSAEPRDGSVVRAQLFEPCDETAVAMMASPFLLARHPAAEVPVREKRSDGGFCSISIWGAGGWRRMRTATFDSRDGLRSD